jgi:hypothetical protein
MRLSKLIPILSVLWMLPCAHGQVVLQDSYAAGAAGGAPTQLDGGSGPWGYEINIDAADFSAAGRGKLVMVYSGKDEDGGDLAGAPVTGVSYAGAALTEAIFHEDANRVSVGIYYLDDVVSDGTLRIELADGNQSEFGFGLYALDGLKPGVQDTATAAGLGEPTAAAVTMTTESGFMVQEAARNNQSFSDDPDDDFETLYYYSGPQSYRALSQFQVTTAPGEYLAPVNNTGRFKRVSAAAFEGIAPATSDPAITSISQVGPDLFELDLRGEADTAYEFYSSATLDFTPGTRVENLSQGDETNDSGTVGGTAADILTTDANGEARVRVILTGSPADFVRAQLAPPPPPLLDENFDAAAALPAGWTRSAASNGTRWEVGAPSGVDSGPAGAVSEPNCAGTNIDGYYTENTDVTLTSPSLAIPADASATLTFQQLIDTDTAGDAGAVVILDADNADSPIGGLEITGLQGLGSSGDGWTEGALALPAIDVGGKNIKVQFQFVSDAGTSQNTDVFGGFYVDDVTVTLD